MRFFLFAFLTFILISCIQKSSGNIEHVNKAELSIVKKTTVPLKFGSVYISDTFFFSHLLFKWGFNTFCRKQRTMESSSIKQATYMVFCRHYK